MLAAGAVATLVGILILDDEFDDRFQNALVGSSGFRKKPKEPPSKSTRWEGLPAAAL